MRDAVTPRPNGGCSATTPLFYFSLPFFTFFIFTEYFLFFFSSTFLAREVPGNPSPPPHPPRSPLGPFTSLPFSHPFSSLPFFLQLEANLPRIPPSPRPAQRSQQVLPTGQRRALLEGMVPHPVGRLQSHPRGWGGGPVMMVLGGVHLSLQPYTQTLASGTVPAGSIDGSSGSLGRLFAPPPPQPTFPGVLQVFWGSPPWARIPAGADAARNPSGRAVPIKLFRCGLPHPLLCSRRFLARFFTAAEAGHPSHPQNPQ